MDLVPHLSMGQEMLREKEDINQDCVFYVQILEKVYVQFQSFLEDPQYKDQHELQATMIRTFGKVAPHAEPHFRDEGRMVSELQWNAVWFCFIHYTRPETYLFHK